MQKSTEVGLHGMGVMVGNGVIVEIISSPVKAGSGVTTFCSEEIVAQAVSNNTNRINVDLACFMVLFIRIQLI